LQRLKIILSVNLKFPLQDIAATSLLTQFLSSLCGGALRDNPRKFGLSEFYWILVEGN